MSVHTPASPRRFPWLTLLACGAAAVIAVPAMKEATRWKDPQELRRVLEGEAAREVYRPEHDPKVGTTVPRLSLADTEGRRVAFPPEGTGRPSALVFVGDCTECVAKTLKQWEKVRQRGHSVYVVTRSHLVDARKFLSESGLKLPMLLESSQPGAGAQYNAMFRPRAYVVGADGKLLYVQPETEQGLFAIRSALMILSRPSRPAKGRAATSRAGAGVVSFGSTQVLRVPGTR